MDESPSPRQVLALLNEMGLQNITAAQLKLFVTDLKKLIRHDKHQTETTKSVSHQTAIPSKAEGPERLYAYSTISSRSKCVSCNKPNTAKGKKNIQSNTCPKHKLDTKHIHRSNQLPINTESKHPMHNEIENKENVPNRNEMPRKMKSSKNFIKIPVCETRKKSDPVSLYHYYSSLWEKYKTHMPGENSWANLRWSIREKLLGEKENYESQKAFSLSEEELAKRREGWID